MSRRADVGCDLVDELGGAVALGGVTADEWTAVAEHLGSCPRPHEELRSLLGAGGVLASALDPVAPSPALRARVMASVAATPQERSAAAAPAKEVASARRAGWLNWIGARWVGGVAAAALLVAAILGAWNLTLQAQVADSQRVTEALADARAVYPVTGEAGQALLLDTPDGPAFLATSLEPPPAGSLYELWLIGEDGVPLDVGVVTDAEGLRLVPLEAGIAGYTTFAVTVETARVEAPTSAPVLSASLGSAPAGS
jgi:anti-sigma-K factor RskA